MSHILPLSWENSHALDGDIVVAVQELKDQDGPPLQIHGSSALIQTLQAHDPIDAFRIWTFPVVVGAGKRLFDGTASPRNYTVVHAETLENSVTHQCFRWARLMLVLPRER
ncbi:dihydrofolate reductase family protein [Tateyamaria omphalii]|uniref:dihydrofolate reductase family protein n=1 Tax=Tateyamaria omphalii TaxID=299262 RepID=UPI0035714B07